MQQQKQNLKNNQEDLRVIEVCDDTGLIRKVSLGQCFVTVHDIVLLCTVAILAQVFKFKRNCGALSC